MGYVALSRVKNLRNLYLTGINQMALQISGDAQNIDILLRDHAAKDAKRFAYLEKAAEKRNTEIPKKTAKASGWSDKIAKMRETYPNAYRPWEASQDAQLKEKFLNGTSIKQLSKLLGRHEGSITMRLQKHFGEDVVQQL
jgi:hypothetical protein